MSDEDVESMDEDFDDDEEFDDSDDDTLGG